MEANVLSTDRSRLDLVGQFVEVRWTATHPMAKRQCEKCVYVVRGLESDMICLDLIYDAIDGVHRTGSVYWVNVLSVQYLKVLSERQALQRIEMLEREVALDHPRD
ncbi:MAG: hypothetical protein K1X67_10245 [Fimbriimonadaceae bacterium]|nr:hypothetical protein [Fimbriimonadaceae bacterium]